MKWWMNSLAPLAIVVMAANIGWADDATPAGDQVAAADQDSDDDADDEEESEADGGSTKRRRVEVEVEAGPPLSGGRARGPAPRPRDGEGEEERVIIERTFRAPPTNPYAAPPAIPYPPPTTVPYSPFPPGTPLFGTVPPANQSPQSPFGPRDGEGPAAIGSPRDAELGKLELRDRMLEVQSRALAERFRHLGDGDEGREAAMSELTKLVEEHFAVRQRRREREIELLEEQLERLRDSIRTRTGHRDAIIKRHLDELTGKDELAF